MRLGGWKGLVSLIYILFEDYIYFFFRFLLGIYISLNEDFVMNYIFGEISCSEGRKEIISFE